MNTFTLKITEIRKQTDDAITICFKQPALKKIIYHSGQYITLLLTINNRKYRRPYSFSSTPIIDSTLEITIKRVRNGIVSNHLIDNTKVGDTIEVSSPMGSFVYKKSSFENKKIFLWGIGSGITPLMSILKDALHDNKKVTLIYGNHNIKQTIFFNQLTEIKDKFKQTFSIFYFFTNEPEIKKYPNSFHGRINSDQIKFILSNNKDLNNSVHYICGPNELKETIRTCLQNHSILPQQIFTENFRHNIEESQLTNIRSTFVSLKIKESFVKLEVIKGKSILDAGLDQQIDLSYSCQTGDCLLCKATLLKGEIKTIGIERLIEGLNENDRLLCCSYPLSDDVVIEIK